MTTLTETDAEELIPVETPPEGQQPDDGKQPDTTGDVADDEDDDDDEGDTRLAASQDDSDDDIASANRRRRKQRSESRKRARERTERELQMLREERAELLRRIAAVEQHTASSAEQAIHSQLQQALQEVQIAESIIAKATEAGNGEDVVQAMRIRDEARDKAAQLQARVQQRPQQSGPDPRVVQNAQAWMQANPWYNPQGTDPDSVVTKTIDAQLVREGFNPASIAYWEELTARVSEALGATANNRAPSGDTGDLPRRKAPPTGTSRGEHAPVSTRREIYVTPERKQAMIEAGVWDDPVKRQKVLKSYQDYDRQSAAR